MERIDSPAGGSAGKPMIASPIATPPADATAPARHPDAPAPGSPCPSRYAKCFGCGRDHPTGLHIQPIAGEGVSVLARFTVTEYHEGAPGLAHGGVLAAAFDETLGSANELLRTPMVTGRLECEYIKPVPVGTVLFISARCTAVAGRKIYASAEARLGAEDGALAARAVAVFIKVPMEHFVIHGRADAAWLASDRGFEVNP